jgi:hypothetical protein
MYRPFVSRVLLLTSLVLPLAACSDNTTTPPTTPTPPEITEPLWNGTLTVNGAVTTNFRVTDIGTVTAILQDLQPNNNATLSIGLDLGTWSGTSCTIKIANANVGIGGGVVGFANGAGELCGRIYDAGRLTEPVTFSVKITHF